MTDLGPPPRAVLFDAGGTLVLLDTARVATTLAGLGLSVTPEAVRAAEGPARRVYERFLAEGGRHADGWGVYARVALERAGVPRERLADAALAVRAEHDRRNLWSVPAPGVQDCLQRLRDAGLRLGVVSNSEGTIGAMLAEIGLAPFFEVVVDSHFEGVQKPDPEIFRRALQRMGALEPTDVAYVGDVPGVDVAGARAAGLRAILVDPADAFADFEGAPRIRSLAELSERWAPPRPERAPFDRDAAGR
ncbi:MAG: HAD family hydrolase [Myxococcota bacterium]|nr:HAD family hydrolase [Myxococcota bacterium]MDW8362758.1 HAD family hydrolase [Myxococcales bacterium]